MPKGVKKRKNKKPLNKGVDKRQIEFKEDGESYGRITKVLGNRRFTVVCDGNKEWLGLLPGRFGRRVRFTSGDVVLIQHRPFGSANVVDIIHKYTPEEARLMVGWNEIPAAVVAQAQASIGTLEGDDDDVMFGDDDDDDGDINIDNI